MADRTPGANPGVSSAKKRRLNALQQRFGSKQEGGPQQKAGPANGGSVGGKPGSAPGSSDQPATFLYDPLDRTRFSSPLARRLEKPAADKGGAAAFLNQLLAETAGAGGGQQAIKQKVQDRVLQLDNPVAAKPATPRRAARKRPQAGAPGRFPAKELASMPADQRRYELYQPLNKLWQAYVAKLLKGRNFEEQLLQADLHGCQLKVVASKVARHVGKQGIVLHDRRNTMTLITTGNQLLRVAKKGGKFRVPLNASHAMVLNGDAMMV